MLYTCSDSQLDTIQFLDCVAKRMIASTFFVDEAFEATELQKILKALPSILPSLPRHIRVRFQDLASV